MQHSPGPWSVDTSGGGQVRASDDKGSFPVCDIRGWGHLTGHGHSALGLSHDEAAGIQDANARLIAAAPDLLAALKLFERQWNACGPNSDFGRYFGNVRDAATHLGIERNRPRCGSNT